MGTDWLDDAELAYNTHLINTHLTRPVETYAMDSGIGSGMASDPGARAALEPSALVIG